MHDERDSNEWRVTSWPATEAFPDPIADAVTEGTIVVHDTLASQLRELVDGRITRRPPPSADEIERGVQAVLGATSLEHHGNWVHYPWSRRLVRVLPEAEFREVRTSRNRNKITSAEQKRLRTLDLGIVGLSVGRATAITLALEGVGGRFRLADFDTLALSNMNRLYAGVHELGVNKAVLTARTLLEIDPYLDLRVYADGLTTENLERFLTEEGQIDVLFEECDDLEVKVRIRDAARRLRIPVLMETSDRGMLDIERFDLEPDRPFFHGLAGELDADSLRGLDTYEKVPVVSAILGFDTLSRRMAASLVDIDAEIKTWPQLASAVALGGALNTEAARRIALGGLCRSGRYHVDLEALVTDVAAQQDAPRATPPRAPREPVHPEPLPALHPSSGSVSAEELGVVLEYAVRAPSGGNAQPWSFELRAGELRCSIDRTRARTLLDTGSLASQLACGAVAEHVTLAASALGATVELAVHPDGPQSEHAFDARFTRPDVAPTRDPLVDQIEHRCTNRRRVPRRPLADDVAARLVARAEERGARLLLVRDETRIAAIAEILGRAERQRLLCPRLHEEMFDEVRWTRDDVLRTRDGLDVETLELDPTERAAMTLLSSREVMATVRSMGSGRGLERLAREAVSCASAVGLLTIAGDGPRAFFEGGRALARVWLQATADVIGFQPITSLLYVLESIRRGERTGLDDDDVAAYRALGDDLDAVVDAPVGHAKVMIFRLSPYAEPSGRSLRRRVVGGG